MSDTRARPDGGASTSGSKGHDGANAFFEQVHDALVHVDDPLRLQTHPLARLAASDARRLESRGRALRQRLLDAVESLRPARDTPIASEAWRRYQVLHLRYVEGLEIAEVRKRLGVSRSEYFREHRRALDGFAALFASLLGPSEPSAEKEPASDKVDASRSGSASSTRHNLPLQLTSFVGREREMAEVKGLLAETRLLTLTGTGGCGKTRLAYKVAAELLDDYLDGVWAVELAALSDPALVLQTVASTLEVREQPGRPPLATLISFLRARSPLLVLDNCEHLLEACAELAEALLRGCPRLRVLATSREPLGISGETSYRVPSLSLPDPRVESTLAILSQCEAVRLFVDRAVSAMPSFAVTDENALSVARICLRLDGMPLAIELAAARVRGLGVEELATRLDDRFSLLTGGSRTALRRQQTLRGTLDWSYDLLSEAERCLFRRLSVFVGGWTLEAAEAVCSGGEVEGHEVVDLLLRLVDRSLVAADVGRQPTRYRLLETIRQYAGEKLLESGEIAVIRDRHLDWCLALADEGAAEEYQRDQPGWQERLAREQVNLLAALGWSMERDEDASRAVRLGVALAAYWSYTARETEVRERLGPVLARSGGDPVARYTLLGYVGDAEGVGQWGMGRARRDERLALARQMGDTRRIANSVMNVPISRPSDVDELIAAHEEALELARNAGDQDSAEDVSLDLAIERWWHGGDSAAARPALEHGLAVRRDRGDQWGTAGCLVTLAEVALDEGELERARALAEEGIALFRQIGRAEWIAFGLSWLGDVARVKERYREAEALQIEAIELFRPWVIGGDWLRAMAFLLRLAGIWVVVKRAGDAARLYGAVHGWMESVGLTVPWKSPRGYQRDEAAARAALGDEAFAAAWTEGRAMTLEQAVAYALRDDA